MRFYIANATRTEWRGPFEDRYIPKLIASRKIEPSRPVLADAQGAQPTQASAVVPEVSNPVMDILKGVALIAGPILAVCGIAALIDDLTEDPETEAIRTSAQRHRKRGAVVFADVPGWPRPPLINGRIPDVYAAYSNRTVVEEYENEESVDRTHARRQDQAFGRWSARSTSRRYTQVIVPGGRGGRR